jgi:hypothetical protein
MVGVRRIGHDSFLQPPIFWRMACSERADAGLEFLTVATRMNGIADIVMTEDGQLRNGVADPVIGLTQGFGTQEVIGRGYEGMVTDIGSLAHAGDTHVGAPGKNAGDKAGRIR